QVEAYNRSSELIPVFEKYGFNEIRPCQQFQPILAGIAGEHLLIALAQRRRVIEQTVFFKPVGVTELERTKPEPLRWVSRRFRVEDQHPFRWLRLRARRSRWFGFGERHVCSDCDHQIINRDRKSVV